VIFIEENRRENMATLLRPTTSLALLCMLAAASARSQEHQESIILSVSPRVVHWAEVYKAMPERPDDPYYHVRVIERETDWEAWQFRELASHMAVTPEALEASRLDATAKTYNYKDVEIRTAYRYWLDNPQSRSQVPVCNTEILLCVRQLQR